ncbi:MAG: aminotransferase class III-fold pyridoxal phosphate-dependent enzyme, partial [Gammaproteobacteria bacterium]|nr:aminotransferase class III-fold pyridoxal phosphate-dependent enzyme [Gammaproteobacteria bacterium]
RENLLDNVNQMSDYLMDGLNGLMDKHEIIGEVRGKGLFVGAELVKDRKTREPVHESVAQAVVSDCLKQGVMIGRTNRSLPEFNNTLCLSPALICTRDDIDEILTSIDVALGNLTK